jgi:precorrin-2 methylase
VKKQAIILAGLLLSGLLALPLACGAGQAAPAPAPLTVTGIVKHPLKLTLEDLRGFQSVPVQMNEVSRDGAFHGVFMYRAVPLRTLLDLARIAKENQQFNKPVDIAIRVWDRAGHQVILSWGEVFFSSPGEITVAYAGEPIMPTHTSCDRCHGPEVFQPALDALTREVPFPKLLVRGDFYTDRCLEGVAGIEVLEVDTGLKNDRSVKLFAPEFRIDGAVPEPKKFGCLRDYQQIEVMKKVVGIGRGYHGLHRYNGVSLVSLLEKTGVAPDLNKVVLVSSPDGFRALFSLGELFLSPLGRRIVVARSKDGKLFKDKGGKFTLVVPDELADDRDIRAVCRIKVLDLARPAKLYIIGVGPGDTNLMTLEALSALAGTQAMAAPKQISADFAPYLRGKEQLFDPLRLIHRMFRKQHPELSRQEAEKQCEALRQQAVAKLKAALAAGKSVAFLDWGDPLIYGSTRWIREYFSDEQIETVPALSSLNVANAMIQRDIGAGGSIVISVPSGLKKNPKLLANLAEHGDTLALFMGLKEFKGMQELFEHYYAADTPVALVFSAGVTGHERLVRTTLGQAVGELEKASEKFLGLIYVGPRLNVRFGECE